ncbi:MAG TPA: PLP-dependent aminotransferase family protein [Candidatus Polarisedimenticolaceae bacterium]|nr:PLP-dependent aminotransferase family protein [Candidatus Polarisedimenticolaceae bacterium]
MEQHDDDAHGPLYRRVADRVAGWISAGRLESGERIPSIRKLARQMSVSVTTVLEAYRLLEDRGLIEARPQSGYYVRRPAPPGPEPARTETAERPAPPDVADLAFDVLPHVGNPDLVPLGAAAPSTEFLPVERLNRLLARAVRLHPDTSHSYGRVPGWRELRVQIARRGLDSGCSFSPDDVITTGGAQQALSLALRSVARPGETVAVESPTYHGLLQAIETQGLRALEIATDPRNGVCLDELRAVVEKRPIAAVAIAPSFGNPLGHSMPIADRRRLVEMLADAGVPLIEDDVYGELPYEGARPQACKAFDRAGGVLLCSSFSKTIAPGYRVGWIVPGRYFDAVQRAKYAAVIATAIPQQMAIAEFLASGGFDRHLRRLRRTYRDLSQRTICAIREHFPDGTRVTRPTGGHLLWIELAEQVDALRVQRQALALGISVLPGPIFSPSGRYRNCLRVNCAVPWSDRIENALRTLGHLSARG